MRHLRVPGSLGDPAASGDGGLLAAGDPKGLVADAWTAREAVRRALPDG